MDIKKIIGAIIAITAFIALIVGATYAYWFWQSDNGNKTTINLVIERPDFSIAGNNVTSSSMAPTTNCAHTTRAVQGSGSVHAVNNTSATMRVYVTLKGMLTTASGRTLTQADREHIHWAIKEVPSASATAYSTANCSASSSTSSYDTGTFAYVTTGTYTDIETTIWYDVAPSSVGNKTYQVYAWIDSSYEYTNVGNEITDPMQNLTINLSFSETSNFTQDLSTYIYTTSSTTASIGESIPNGMETYRIASTAMANFNHPTALKHKITSGTIEESYVVFTITPEMAANNNGLQAGTYELKGGDGGAAFLTNAKTIYDAFRGAGCNGDSNLPAIYDSTYNPNNSSAFSCGVSGLGAYAGSGGVVHANVIGWGCDVNGYGRSHCYE